MDGIFEIEEQIANKLQLKMIDLGLYESARIVCLDEFDLYEVELEIAERCQ